MGVRITKVMGYGFKMPLGMRTPARAVLDSERLEDVSAEEVWRWAQTNRDAVIEASRTECPRPAKDFDRLYFGTPDGPGMTPPQNVDALALIHSFDDAPFGRGYSVVVPLHNPDWVRYNDDIDHYDELAKNGGERLLSSITPLGPVPYDHTLIRVGSRARFDGTRYHHPNFLDAMRDIQAGGPAWRPQVPMGVVALLLWSEYVPRDALATVLDLMRPVVVTWWE